MILQEERQVKINEEVQGWIEKKRVQISVQKQMENKKKKMEEVCWMKPIGACVSKWGCFVKSVVFERL